MSDSCVYVADADKGWLPAHVLSQTEKEAVVKVFQEDGTTVIGERTVTIGKSGLPLQNVTPSGELMEMADMVDLPSLHEAAILYNLKQRHATQKPYTRVGDLMIAVNPFQWMAALYSEENRNLYVNKLIFEANPDRSSLAPHVYETSCLAYRGLAMDGKHQSILVSGESGAGKTETVKIVMRHLSSVAMAGNSDGGDASSSSSSLVVTRVLDGQPLLEAFGNAKTVRNDNSSRFGKFIQMQFDVEDATQAAYQGRLVPNCVLCGSTCETYLLEKSRVVSHEPDERTYHIFYQMLATSDDMKQTYMPHLAGKTAVDFAYVGHSDTNKIEGMFDGDRFMKTLEALKLLDMSDESLKMLFNAVSCVLQLGNIIFGDDPEDSEKCIITSADALSTCAAWLGVSTDALQQALLIRTVVAGKETYQVPLKTVDARDGCDALAKEIYTQIFDWLVRNMNQMTCAENNYDDDRDVEQYGLIGLLDIFGFESFQVNRFEQLCINYTNEKLQQKYTLDIFRSVQDEYSQEGIELGEISFQDNADVLRLLEGKIGIISVLNEECVRPKGNDTAFVSKVKTVNREASCLLNEKLHKPTEFAIAHYAGVVKYDATNFVQKNTDALPRDTLELACLSTNEIIQKELQAAADAKAPRTGKRGAATLTVATKFKAQLTRLMTDIAQTNTRYVRCIKPNPKRIPRTMDMFSSAEQLRCAGVVAAVTISRVAFPNRLMHETALERFTCLSHVTLDALLEQKKAPTDDDRTGYKDVVSKMFSDLLKEMEKSSGDSVTLAFECGKSRIYFRSGALESLEARRLVALGTFATVIERMVRGFTAHSLFWKKKYASIDSQANARRVLARKKFLRAKAAAIAMECWIRCVFSKRRLKFLQREKATTQIQSKWRSVMAVAMLSKCKVAVIGIQKMVRGALQRPKYRQALKEAEEEARVNSKLAALQKRLKEAEMKFFQADKQRIEAEKRAAGLAGSGAVAVAPTQVIPAPAPSADAPITEIAPPTAVATSDDKEEGPGSEQQKALIDESNEMLDYFRKEVFKLKSANYLLRTDLAALQEDHRRLQVHSQATEASYSAMNKNVAKLSENNMKLAVQLAEEKSFIVKLKKDLKMDKIRNNAELQRKNEELLGRDKKHEAEMNRMKREMNRLRQVISKDGGEVPPEDPAAQSSSRVVEQRFERASFQPEQFKTSLLRSLDVHKNKEGASSLSKASKGLILDGGASSTAVSSEEEGNWRTVNKRRFSSSRRQHPNQGYYTSPQQQQQQQQQYQFSPPPYRNPRPPHTSLGSAGRGRPNHFPRVPVGFNPIGPSKVNPGTSLGAAAQSSLVTAKSNGSSLAAAAMAATPSTSKAPATEGGGSSLSRASQRK